MRTFTPGRTGLRLLAILAAVIAALFFVVSCSNKIAFTNSAAQPAATGKVKVKKDRNDNYSIDLLVRNLAPSKNLTPTKKTYVVWAETESDGVKNLGRLNSSTSLFSKALKASLETKLSVKPKKIFITAEDEQNTQYPGPDIVLTTESF